MVRILCVVSYDGSNYSGYQKQLNAKTIQNEIEHALKTIHKSEVKIFASGRTDALVHAYNQIFHFDTELILTVESWKKALNSLLPQDIFIKDVKIVANDFHARYNVSCKEYLYKVNMGEFDVFNRKYCYQLGKELDILKMKEAAKLFIGSHDFYNFCGNDESEKESFVRKIFDINFILNDKIVIISIIGDGFLRYMVRSIVGALLEIGLSRKNEEIITSRLDNKIENHCPYTAPPEGLYLNEVKYREEKNESST